MNVYLTPRLQRDIKYYRNKKKYLKIGDDVDAVISEIEKGVLVGDRLDNLHLPGGGAVYKVRLANSSANVGASNGFRLLYYVMLEDEIYLLTIYSKKDDTRVPNDGQIATLVRNLLR